MNGGKHQLYRTLNVSSTASAAEIKTAYRRLALQHHPDKQLQQQQTLGNNEDQDQLQDRFKGISRAYEVLSDERLREIYDRHGEMGLDLAEHMGEMSFVLTKEGESMILAFLCLLAGLVAVVALFFILVALNGDRMPDERWSWLLVCIPLWLVDLLLAAFVYSRYLLPAISLPSVATDKDHNNNNLDEVQSVGTDSKEEEDGRGASGNGKNIISKYERMLGLLRTGQFILVTVFQVMIALRADGIISVQVSSVFVPWFLFELSLLVGNLLSFAGEVAQLYGSVSSPLRFARDCVFEFVAATRYWTVRISVAILICLQLDQGYSQSWFIVFLPLYLGSLMVILTPAYRYILFKRIGGEGVPEDILQVRFSSVVAQTSFIGIFSALFLVVISLLAVRLNAGPGGISFAVILIPVFIVLGIVFCCSCCCVPCAVISGGLHPDLESQSNPLNRRRIEL